MIIALAAYLVSFAFLTAAFACLATVALESSTYRKQFRVIRWELFVFGHCDLDDCRKSRPASRQQFSVCVGLVVYFRSGTGPYAELEEKEAYATLVERVESAIAAENAATLEVMTLGGSRENSHGSTEAK